MTARGPFLIEKNEGAVEFSLALRGQGIIGGIDHDGAEHAVANVHQNWGRAAVAVIDENAGDFSNKGELERFARINAFIVDAGSDLGGAKIDGVLYDLNERNSPGFPGLFRLQAVPAFRFGGRARKSTSTP